MTVGLVNRTGSYCSGGSSGLVDVDVDMEKYVKVGSLAQNLELCIVHPENRCVVYCDGLSQTRPAYTSPDLQLHKFNGRKCKWTRCSANAGSEAARYLGREVVPPPLTCA